jgi:archaellum biogenesis ATPase FlaH
VSAVPLPSATESERSLLGAVLTDGALLERVKGIVRPEDFGGDALRNVYEAALSLSARGEGVDLVTVGAELDRTGRLERAGGLTTLTSLVDDVPDVENVRSYANAVAEASKRRGIVLIFDKARTAAATSSRSAEEIRRSIQAELSAAFGNEPQEGSAARTWAGAYSVAEILKSETYTGPRYPTGLKPLDDLLTPFFLPAVLAENDPTRLGLYPKKILALVGQPHKGKTGLAAQIAHGLAAQGARVVALLDDEPRREFAARLAQLEGFPPAEVALAPDYPATLEKIGERFARLDLELFPDSDHDEPRPTIEDMAERLLSRPAKLHVLVIDSLHKATCREEGPDDGALERIEKRCSVLRRLRTMGPLIIFTAEANRASYASPDPMRRSNSIAASGDSRAVEYLAEVQLVVSAAEGELFGVDVPKNRLTGKLGKFTLTLNRERARFEAVTDSDAEARAEEARARDEERKDREVDRKVIRAVARHPEGIARSKVAAAAGVRRQDAVDSLNRLIPSKRLTEDPGVPPKNGGNPPMLLHLGPNAERAFPSVPGCSGERTGTLDQGAPVRTFPPYRGERERTIGETGIDELEDGHSEEIGGNA